MAEKFAVQVRTVTFGHPVVNGLRENVGLWDREMQPVYGIMLFFLPAA